MQSPGFLVLGLGWIEVLVIEMEKTDNGGTHLRGKSYRFKVTDQYWLRSEWNVKSGHSLCS